MQRIGGYRLVEELGRGGMAVVFRAQSPRGEDCAIKILHRQDPRAKQRFLREAQVLAELSHPAIVPLRAVGEDQGVLFLAMPYFPGPTLAGRVADGPLPIAEALEVAEALADGLAYAHDHGVLHRDVKPDNVLLDREGRARLTDFGLARRTDVLEPRLSQTGALMGTPGYLAPEQAGSGEPVGVWTDVYGLGATLYAMLTGVPPVEGRTLVEVVRAVIEGQVTPPSALRPEVSPALDALCLRCLAGTRARRFADARELRAALEAVRVGAAPRRAPRWALGAVGLGLAAALAVGLWGLRPGERARAAAAPALGEALGLAGARLDAGDPAGALAALDAVAAPDSAPLWQLRARALFALEDASAAEAAVQAALEVAPTDAELHLLRARIQVAREDFPGALASLSEAIVCGGGPAAEFVRVDVRRASGDSEGAAAELERITSRHPTLREGWERRLRLAGDEYEAQRTVLDQALRCLPEDTAFLARRAELLVGLERDEEAQADLLRAQALGSRSPRLLLVRSRLRRHADDGEGALADALAALRPALDLGPAWCEVGYSLAHRGDYAASHVALVQAHAFQPRDLPTRTVLAQVKVALSDFEQASRLLEAALATRTPTIPGPLGILADAYIGQERYAEAEATLGFVLGYESADQGLYRGKRGMVRVELERDALAVPDLRAGLASSPADPQLWAYLAAALANLGRDEEALDALRRAIVCGAERDVPMVFNLAKLALRLERWEEARVELAELCRRTPEDGESHYQLARCALKLGDWAAGLAPARRALELDPDSLSAQLVLTELLMNLGEHAQALEVLDSAIGQHPDARGPRRARVDVLNALGRPEDALAGLDAYLERWPDDAGALGNRAGLRSTLEDYAGAEADVARALELDPYDVAARYNRAHLHLRADRFVDVLVDVAVILARDPHDFDAWCLRVEGLRYLGRRYEALATAEAALQAQPDHPHARWAQALIEDLR